MATQLIDKEIHTGGQRIISGAGRSPVTRDLALPTAFSLVIALLMIIVVIGGLIWRSRIYPAEEVLLSFLPVDLFHLGVGLPVLLGSLWLARQGHLAGLLCWPGALLYVLYSYITNLLGVPFGLFFLPYLILVTLSAYTVIALVASIDGDAVRERLRNAVPERTTGAILAGFAGLFLLMGVSTLIRALASQPPALPAHPLFVLIADFTTAIPPGLAAGVLLWRREALGYLAGAGLLLFYCLLLLGLVPVLLFPTFYNGSPVSLVDTILMGAMGLLCLWFLARFVRASSGKENEDVKE